MRVCFNKISIIVLSLSASSKQTTFPLCLQFWLAPNIFATFFSTSVYNMHCNLSSTQYPSRLREQMSCLGCTTSDTRDGLQYKSCANFRKVFTSYPPHLPFRSVTGGYPRLNIALDIMKTVRGISQSGDKFKSAFNLKQAELDALDSFLADLEPSALKAATKPSSKDRAGW